MNERLFVPAGGPIGSNRLVSRWNVRKSRLIPFRSCFPNAEQERARPRSIKVAKDGMEWRIGHSVSE